MKKLFLAILLSIGIALSGCAGMMKTGTQPDTKTLPGVQYITMDFFSNGKLTYIPNHIRINEPIWMPNYQPMDNDFAWCHFSIDTEKMSFFIKESATDPKILLLIYGKIDNTGKPNMEFYIYDGKPYPVKTTEDSAKAYYRLKTGQEII